MNTTYEKYLAALAHYCQYRERSHQEVKAKLLAIGARGDEVEQIIAQLITKGLLSEERYARSYARGHFRLKQWGKQKIVAHLKQQHVSVYCIKKALAEIDDDEYSTTLQKLLSRKAQELKITRLTAPAKAKLYRYLIQKGYEAPLVNEGIVKYFEKATS